MPCCLQEYWLILREFDENCLLKAALAMQSVNQDSILLHARPICFNQGGFSMRSLRSGSHTLNFQRMVPLDLVRPDEEDGDTPPDKAQQPYGNCCGGPDTEGGIIMWWYEKIGTKHFGIHVNWEAWKPIFDEKEGSPCEMREYYHEFFHHVIDSFRQVHNLQTPKMNEQYDKIWTKELAGGDGILLGEALAEAFSVDMLPTCYQISKARHPSYNPHLGSWAYLSLRHLYQLMNDDYEIFKSPMQKLVDDRQLVNNLRSDYEQYEGPLWSVGRGFVNGKKAFDLARNHPSELTFYVHACAEEWKGEVFGFVDRNSLAQPKFVA
jgi:hypothetical protein